MNTENFADKTNNSEQMETNKIVQSTFEKNKRIPFLSLIIVLLIVQLMAVWGNVYWISQKKDFSLTIPSTIAGMIGFIIGACFFSNWAFVLSVWVWYRHNRTAGIVLTLISFFVGILAFCVSLAN